MKTHLRPACPPPGLLSAISLAVLVSVNHVSAQTVAPVDPSTASQPAATATAEETIVLTPFQVKADAADTYNATNTNSVTGTNTPLSKTPLDAKVFNRELMDELGVVDMTEMLAKLGGLGPAIIGGGNEDLRGLTDGDRQDPKSMTMRGLAINNPRRDGFLRSDTSTMDSFDVERVEAIGGSNSLLFGSGDAGGVVTTSGKRAYLNRRRVAVTAMGDSEGTRRYTVDAGAGNRMFAVRVNAVKSETRFFRPLLGQSAEGTHFTATFLPWKRLEIRAEYREFSRDAIIASGNSISAPSSLKLSNGATLNGQNIRYALALPGGSDLLGGKFDLTNVDSVSGPFRRDCYFNRIKSIVFESALTDHLAVQLRVGEDGRVNRALYPTNTTLYHPDSPANLYADANGNLLHQWALNTSMADQGDFWTGARGYRAAAVYQHDFKRWGRHQASVFRQDMLSWVWNEPWKFYEADANGNVIQDKALITNSEAGRTAMPAVWMPAFPTSLIGGASWYAQKLVHPNGKTYINQQQFYPGAVTPTAGNPMGLSGPINATTGQTTSGYYHDETRERSWGAALFSTWWKDRIDTMAGFRREEASTERVSTGVKRGPIQYDSLTTGMVFNTPVKGLRGYVNYATNGKINFDTTRDIFNNPLPPGKGVSKEIGFKSGLWEDRLSGNVGYYVSEAKNFTATLGSLQNDIDPAGINGRHGGGAYTYSKTSNGLNVTLTARPLRGWEVRLNFASANGSERSNVVLPQFYNDQFNTMTVNGQTVVAVKSGSATTPLVVPADPTVADSPQIPLSLTMMKDPASPYFALLDPEGGQILNAQALGLNTPGVGTTVNGLPITEHQLGFVSPSGGTIIVRKAGEKTVGYAERSYSLINRYQFLEGRLRGLVVGLSTSYQQNFRAYMYNDVADGGKRKTLLLPNRYLNDAFARYNFSPTRRIRAAVQLNVSNIFDANRTLYLLRSSDGTVRYAQWFNTPRKLSLTTTFAY